jgi:hypothetical protein
MEFEVSLKREVKGQENQEKSSVCHKEDLVMIYRANSCAHLPLPCFLMNLGGGSCKDGRKEEE